MISLLVTDANWEVNSKGHSQFDKLITASLQRYPLF